MSDKMKIGFVLLSLLAALMLGGCGSEKKQETGKTYDIYYVSNEETKIFSNPYQTETEEKQALLEELVGQLSTIPEKMEYKAPLAGNFELLGYTWDTEQLTMNFDEHYREMNSILEILVRAAIVRTLTQVDGVKSVSFTIQNEPLMDNGGVAVGTMSADMFIDNAGNEINTYEKANLRLYFANEDGTRLVEEDQRNLVYNSNIPIERLVLDRLILGPTVLGNYPTINPAAKVVGVTVKDGTCYVNLDETFLSQPYDVTSNVTIYSITNSLVELPNVNRVQISINGDTSLFYQESISLTNVFERNLDLIVNTASADK
ncbi:MAG: GerMN domain-containing protein [Blautia sp.]|nr:GerMN domain-containing protein [Lachnoclostridium sp.]MCM1212584.1 GerMN domain-containing protein [Blautia sp.]